MLSKKNTNSVIEDYTYGLKKLPLIEAYTTGGLHVIKEKYGIKEERTHGSVKSHNLFLLFAFILNIKEAANEKCIGDLSC